MLTNRKILINFLRFCSIANEISHPTLTLESSEQGYHTDTFLDLLIRVHNKKFVIGIYHKVDDFSFEVINFPFPDSNIHSETGYNCFYSQLIRFFQLCNNVTDFGIRVHMVRAKLCARGYKVRIMHKCFLKFCRSYPVVLKYSASDTESLWLTTYRTNVSSCNVSDVESVKKLIKPSKILLINSNINSKD